MDEEKSWYGYVVDLAQSIPAQLQSHKINEWAASKNITISKIYKEKSKDVVLKSNLDVRSTLQSMFTLLEEGDSIVVYDFNIVYPADSYIPDFLKLLKDNNITLYSACRDNDAFSYIEESETRLKKFVPEDVDMPVEIDYTPTNICYGYIRVSTQMQVDDGISLESQEYEIRKKAAELNLVVVEIYKDAGKTGTNMDRPGLAKALANLKSGQTLISYALSRMARNMRDFFNMVYDITEMGARLIMISNKIDTNEPFVKLHLMFQAYMAEQEVTMIRERVSSAMKLKQANKEHVGRIPYGYQLKNGKGSGLIENPDEQAIIEQIKKLVDEDKLSYSAIARQFNDNGVKLPKKATTWAPATVSRIYNRGEVATKGRKDK